MIKLFLPAKKYAAISITGASCQLNCLYCGGKYLLGMLNAGSPGQLKALARRLKKKGVEGVLISGGFTLEGKLPFKPFLDAIRYIKKRLGMVVSIHPGLIDRDEAKELRRAGVDVVDFELILDPYVISFLKRLKAVSYTHLTLPTILLV